jgi:hypothetical protein
MFPSSLLACRLQCDSKIQSALEKRLNGVNQYDVKRVITKATWAEIRTAYASGIGLREIARNMDIPEGTVLVRKSTREE